MGYSKKTFIIPFLLGVSLALLLWRIPLDGNRESLRDLLISSIAVLSVIYAVFFPLYLDYLRRREVLDFPVGENYFYFVFLFFSSVIFLFLMLLYSVPTNLRSTVFESLNSVAFIAVSLTGVCLILVAPFITTSIVRMFAHKVLVKGKPFNMEALLDNLNEGTIGIIRRIGLDGDWDAVSREYMDKILRKIFDESLHRAFENEIFFETFFGSRKRWIPGGGTEGIISIYFKKLPLSNLGASDLTFHIRKRVGGYVSFARANLDDDSTAFTDTIREIAEFSLEMYRKGNSQYRNELQSLHIFLLRVYLGLRGRKRDGKRISALIHELYLRDRDFFMSAYTMLNKRVSVEDREDLSSLLRIMEASP